VATTERFTVTVSAPVAAPPARVYGIIADYHHGHPRILPRKYFGDLVVERGGIGAGTVIRFDMKAFGSTRTARATVTEPEPGRVLVETIEAQGIVTRFVVDPDGSPDRARVTFTTSMPSRGGLLGRVERALSTGYLKRVYEAELKQLEEVATETRDPALDARR
jgi:hypothetical protein